MKAFFKKVIYLAVATFLLVSVVNLVLGFLFWVKNSNNKPLEGFEDAPYLYFVHEGFEQGFNVPDNLTRLKKPGELRVVVLGGSVAYSLVRVRNERGHRDLYLQSLLQKQFPNNKITLINAALPAYVSQQEFLALQMQFQHYNPDLVLALHGYNDIESFRINHLADSYTPSPLFYAGSWNSPLFNVVSTYKKVYEPSSIWNGYYNHISKGVDYTRFILNLRKNPTESTEDINPKRIDDYVASHINITQDLKDFCRAKGFVYLNFLQPVQFYRPYDEKFYGENEKPISAFQTEIYSKIEKGLQSMEDHYSLTHLDPVKLEYLDECHPDSSGYRYMADTIASKVGLALDKILQKGIQK